MEPYSGRVVPGLEMTFEKAATELITKARKEVMGDLSETDLKTTQIFARHIEAFIKNSRYQALKGFSRSETHRLFSAIVLAHSLTFKHFPTLAAEYEISISRFRSSDTAVESEKKVFTGSKL